MKFLSNEVTLLLTSFLFVTSLHARVNNGKFWHVTDLHLDFYYDETKIDANTICPSSFGENTMDAGPFGDYRCDSPWRLVQSAISAMKNIEGDPDFIIWTGDDTLHTSDEDKYLGTELVLETIRNLTDLIKGTFPNTTVHACLGNHDYHHKSQIPPGPSYILSNVAEYWRDWMTEEQFQMFNSTGQYSVEIATKVNLISLNTNVWYTSNHGVNGTGDPGSYFKWFENQLQQARTGSAKVYVIGHVPPGHFELVDYKYWFYPSYNERYVDIIRRYSDVIIGQFFGHHHTDTFRMFYDENNKAISNLLIAPGVTPWMTTLPGAKDGANNPGVRLFEYDVTTMIPTDYVQYYLNLPDANNNGRADWLEEYRATSAFELPDLTTSSWDALSKRLASADVSDQTSEDTKMLQKFSEINSVSYNFATCDKQCQLNQVCAVRELNYEKYKACVSGGITLVPVFYLLMFSCAVLSILML
uniref:acid sphingomyelinase-like phosphodiesterase 3b n=1 Tax=Ciona intestinalis TaxID=7719 RepID=UPI000180D0D5|nr:acid sphingomyelinase-like phosphodiesterase 3b [Ciona intestinalis]|eukprot:XP_002122011.1 acid sphingomyelinase-like phosphodiesterase 3b [Ciona intestinalis]